jgi:hypothetical protein
MPTRLLREGILDSERVDRLDAPAEVFYRRLMSKVDDFGLFDARLAMLRSSLFALRVDRVREADIARWIAACEKAGVIALYEHGGKPYGQMLDTKWQVRSEPKHPLPPWGKGTHPGTVENSGSHPESPVTVFGDGVVVETPQPPTGGFDVFWTLWPKHTRKVAQKQCAEKWRTQGCDAIAERVIAALRAAIKSEAWTKDKGKFIPAPLVWLNQNRWEAPTDDEASAGSGEWFDTWAGVKAKGAELGLQWREDGWVAGEHMSIPVYRAKVFKAAGHSPRAAA